MKANRRIREDQDGVSNVLGGILFFSIVILFLLTIRLTYVPVWEEDREVRHMSTLHAQLVDIKSEMDRQAGNRTSSAVGHPLTLQERTASKFFTDRAPPADLSFVPKSATAKISTDELLVFVQNGRSLAGANETWTLITGPITLQDVDTVQHLRLRLEDPSSADPGDHVEMTITDANGDFAGSLRAYLERDPPDNFIFIRVTNAQGVTIYDQGTFFHQTGSVPFWWIDALADELHFSDLLNAAQGPLELQLVESNMDAAYTITYVESGDAGGVVGSSGKIIQDFEEVYTSGTMSVEARNSHYVQQTYALENGGIILDQQGKAVMRTGPALIIAAGDATTVVKLTVPGMTGQARGVSHPGTVTVTSDALSARGLEGTAPMLKYEVSSKYPQAWADHFDEIASTGGLSSSAGEYVVEQTAGTASITIYGRTTAPSSTDHDLRVGIDRGNIDIRIQK